jgi:site-specific DNA-methyltransferase (adenine-specific)
MSAALTLFSDGSPPSVPALGLGDVVLQDANALLRSLAPATVAAVITDPPYGIAFQSNRRERKDQHAPIANDWNFQIGPFLRAAERVLVPGGAMYLFCRFDVYPLWVQSIPPELTLSNMIVWDKAAHSSGDLTGNFGFRHELVMFLTKGRHWLRGYRWPNVWQIPRVAAGKLRMPAEKPVAAYERAIESSTLPEDLVVDPFGGSGTCAEAAQRLGRRFLVADIDKRMVALGRERVGLPALLDLDAELAVSAPECPVFGVKPPSPAMWGLHPEDVASWREGQP